MKEWFCEKCHYVWMAKDNECCNQLCKSLGVEFDPCIHGKFIGWKIKCMVICL